MPCIAGRARTGGKILHTGAVCYPAYQLVTVGAFVIYVDLPGDIPVGDIFDRNAALGAFDLENIRTERGLLGKRRPQRDGCLEPGYIGRQFFSARFEQLHHGARGNGGEVEFVFFTLAAQHDVSVLHGLFGRVSHRQRKDLGDGLVGAVLNEHTGISADALDHDAVADVGAVKGGGADVDPALDIGRGRIALPDEINDHERRDKANEQRADGAYQPHQRFF